MNDVTRILSAMEQGDPLAAEQLLPQVYQELRKLAAQKLAQERPGQTLQPTALVHEAYLRLVGPATANRWDHRGHFFAAAAEAMRRILVEAARHKGRLKRGGEIGRADFDLANLAAPERHGELLAVDEALSRLEKVDPNAAELVKLRYFAGLSMAADGTGGLPASVFIPPGALAGKPPVPPTRRPPVPPAVRAVYGRLTIHRLAWEGRADGNSSDGAIRIREPQLLFRILR